MLYRINDVTISLGGEEVLSHIGFEIHGNEKIAITGRNGAGKTTLLRFIAGEIQADRDDKRKSVEVESARKVTVAMLRQTGEDETGTCHSSPSEVKMWMAHNDMQQNQGMPPESEEWEYDRLLTGFGFAKEDRERPYESFSGGEQTKLRMIRLLLEKPDILLLDEPTNHLDMKTVEWLEEYLRHYEKAVVFVSHDRFFIDRVADVVYEAENHRLTRYVGNYTSYRQQKRKANELAIATYERHEKEVARLKTLIDKFKNKPSKAAFARSRMTMLKRMGTVDKPAEDFAHIFTRDIEPLNISGKWVVDAEHLKCGYPDKLCMELSMKIRRGDKVAIIGDNGSGKTTFLKTVIGQLRALDGKITLGNRVETGYFDQRSAEISSELTVYEHFRQKFPNMDEKQLRTSLASYLFRDRDAFKQVNVLSGGEKARLVLAEMLTERPNFLVLDEPTNHMDIDAKETLESAFKAYTGTILVVSHDRYLISRLADSFYIFEDGHALFYPFDYEHYLERLERLVTARRIIRDMNIPDMADTPEKAVRSEIMGLVAAEDAAMIAGLKAVPKKERHEIGFKNTEEAHADWKLRLAQEELDAARAMLEAAGDFDSYESAQERLAEAEARWYEVWSEMNQDTEVNKTDSEDFGTAPGDTSSIN